MTAPAPSADGIVTAVHGGVVDIVFPDGSLPPLRRELLTAEGERMVFEVAAHRDAHTVRAVALGSTRGLARGAPVTDTGEPLRMPVGDALLGRVLNVFGEPLDGMPLPDDVEWRPIHRAPVPLADRRIGSEVFETGIKAIDLLAPIERGGKAGLFGGAGVGKTV
ncbi:MAG TPA: F0F1 ATP synthase subunit beta, partial [Gemmatimonadales bacterium]|nr:F0F1 ATP synthase subunit beta [Gemmatimonadales bacterium]